MIKIWYNVYERGFSMNLFNKFVPTVVIDGKSLENQIEELKTLLPKVNEEGKAKLEKDIKFLEIGLSGEKKILFELQNSNIPMYIFHDVYYEFDDLSVQIDFIIVTAYKIFVVECKNIAGDIIINNDGNFIRNYNGKSEGFYSPITQNERHIDLISNMLYSKKGFLGKILFNNTIKQNIESLVVFVNPKTIIKKYYAPKRIKSKIIRADEINSYIKSIISKCEYKKLDIKSFANFFEFYNIKKEFNYSSKYDKYLITNKTFDLTVLKEDLRKYRLEKSKICNVKPYIIFTNEQLDNIIELLPKSKDDLLNINGFGQFKVSNYGEDIISIVKKYVE